jgi:hypothetical protein
MDVYAGKEMTYITDDDLNYEPHLEDNFFIIPNQPPFRWNYGGNVKMEAHYYEMWDRFQKYIERKQLVNFSSKIINDLNLHMMQLYINNELNVRFDIVQPEEEFFEFTYNELMVIENYNLTIDSEKLTKFINTGAVYIAGRLNEVGR